MQAFDALAVSGCCLLIVFVRCTFSSDGHFAYRSWGKFDRFAVALTGYGCHHAEHASMDISFEKALGVDAVLG